jgi:hypothetical protein
MPQTTEFRLGIDGVAAFEFSDGTTKDVDLANLSGGGGSGSTNLSLTQTASNVTVVSDTGADATIPAATTSNAGVMAAADKVKLDAQPATPVTSVAARTGAVVLTKTDVGLANVDNTSDASKPVSTAQATAIAAKQDQIASGTAKLLSAPATTGGAPVQITLGTNLSLSGNTLNAAGGGSAPIVNDLTTGGTTSALSAEMGKVLQTTKAAAINASPVVGAGVTSLTRTAVTTSGAEAPTGYYNRPLISDHSVTVDVTGAVAGDALMVLNSAGSNITLTASGTVVTIAAGKTGEVVYNGTAWVDPAVAGASYTDAQALAASVLSGTLGTDTTKAPTHSAVTNAIAAAGVGGGNVSTIAPTTFSTVPVSTTRGVLASVTVPANTLGARGLLKALAEYSKSGATDVGSYSIRLGAIGGTSATAIEVGLLNTTAANTVASIAVHIRAVGSTLVVLKNSPGPWGSLTSATSVAVDQSAGFVVYFCATTLTTDTASLIGAHVEYSKVA